MQKISLKVFFRHKNNRVGDCGILHKISRALCMMAVFFGIFTLPSTSFAWETSFAYDCKNGGDFPMTFGGCKPGYYYENWQYPDSSLDPEEVGECIKCPSGYTCVGGFAGPTVNNNTLPENFTYPENFTPYEYTGGGSKYDCGVGHFPMYFAGCKPGYYYEDWQDADSSLYPEEIGDCIACSAGYTCCGGFAGPVSGVVECGGATVSGCSASEIDVNGDGTTCETAKFTIRTTDNTDFFKFSMSAAGTFYIDWGDGTIEEIDRTDNTTPADYSHTYDDADEYTIRFGGIATEYNDYDGSIDDETVNFAAISFGMDAGFEWDYTSGQIASISGSLGAIFPTIGSGNTLSTQPRFARTFAYAENLTGSIPSNLFGGISGAPAMDMFSYTFSGCSGLSGSIPENLFAGISGAPAHDMFASTFSGCSGLSGAIPENLFAGISGAPAHDMFSSTFADCSGLSGSIPSNLFAGISGAPTPYMFEYTFYNCSGLTGSIPANLFAGISGAPAQSMFQHTFYGCSGLSGSIPENLFAGIKGAPASGMFFSTFNGCSKLTGSIPENLFAGISGATASSMFDSTFYNCSRLSGAIPENLFAGISGAPADHMFSSTFFGCSRLSGSIPENLFAGISGAPAENMFSSTFSGCSGLTGSIPGNLFAGISGAPALNMFYNTFYGCSGLSSYIPPTLFAGISKTSTASNQMNSVFFNTGLVTSCPSGTTQYTTGFESYFSSKVSCTYTSAPVNLYQNASDSDNTVNATVSATVDTTMPSTDTSGTTLTAPTRAGHVFLGYYSARSGGTKYYNADMTSAHVWNLNYGDGLYAQWERLYPFSITTTSMTANDTFKWSISAAGTFWVDCGDGGVLSGDGVSGNTITRSNTTMAQYTCTYPTAGTHTIRFGGTATGYDATSGTSGSYAAIGFSTSNYSNNTPTKIAGISGSLGAIFGTIGTGDTLATQPRFQYTFAYCSRLTGSIPANLFAGITGAPAERMFYQTFYNCSGLTGSIPENLFAGISGAPAPYMFAYTFAYCSGLSGAIPANLFAGINGAPAPDMFVNTFRDCSGLTGSIPANLFAGISGAPALNMFFSTFCECSGLTGSIPSNLFAGISGAPANGMFSHTFYNCNGLTGSIPENLFAGILGAPALNMFYNTFNGCSGLTGSIPANIFAGISGAPAERMFQSTFYNCSGLTGFTDGTNTVNYVPGNFLSGITTASSPTNQAQNMFTSTGLASSCPSGTTNTTRSNFTNAGKPWCDTAYTITLNTNSGSFPTGVVAPTEYTDNKLPLTLPTPIRDGYTFGGWYDNAEFTGNAITEIPSGSTGNKTYWAKWGEITYPFSLTTTSMAANDTFEWSISASGTFWVDCGDGGVLSGTGVSGNTITRSNTTMAQYTCKYPTAGTHTIRFGGTATGYNADSGNSASYAAIGFSTDNYSGNTPTKIASISGSLGAIFGTIGTGDTLATQPRFIHTFYNATNMTGSIPVNLFAGISGAPALNMFFSTFYNCSGLTGAIPENLFAGIKGTPAHSMFYHTFSGCSGLTGSIPENLFAGIKGAPATKMFFNTFYGCSGLTGSIPANLFAGITGAPAEYMFYQTFYNCSGLTGSIPANLFAGISGAPATYMFAYTFAYCSNLSGSIPANLFAGITGAPATYMFVNTFRDCSGLTGSIPANLFAGISGAPALNMFFSTFYNCSGLTGAIPENLFAGIKGTPAHSMFYHTFYNCSGLTGSIPENLFAGILGAPAEYMFDSTFNGCSGLSGSIPANLFAGISGAPAERMFQSTFYNCSGLTGFTDGTNTVNYVPGDFLSGITTASSPTNQAQNMFTSTGLASSCPSGTTTTTRSNFTNAGKPWCGASYTITYNLNDGAFPVGVVADTSYITEMTPKTLPTPIRDGYTFGGWYDNAEFTGEAITEIPSGSTGNKEYWAKWNDAIVSYTITLNTDSGTFPTDVVVPTEYTDSDLPLTLPTPTRDGYTFAGWYDNAEFTGDAITEIPSDSTGNKEYWAKWTGIVYNVSYSCGDGDGVPPSNDYATYGQTFTPAFNTCSKTGYKFVGWLVYNGNHNGDIELENRSFTWKYTEDKLFIAQWDTDEIRYKFYCSQASVNSNEYYDLAVTDTRKSLVEIPMNADVPAYTPNQVVLRVLNQGSANTSSSIGLQNTDIIIPSTENCPENKSKYIDKWICYMGKNITYEDKLYSYRNDASENSPGYYYEETGKYIIDGGAFGTSVPKEQTLRYKPNYSLGFTHEQGTVRYRTMGIKYDQNIGNFRFEPYISDVVCAAIWTDKVFNISYKNIESSDLVGSIPYTYKTVDTPISLPSPTRDGFDFGGWYDNDKFTGEAITEIPSGSTGDKEFWAKWINASCPVDYFAPSDHPEMCFPHVLHIGDNVVYLKSTKQTTPSLNVGMGNDVFYANMTTTATPMNSATERYLKIMYNNTVYYVCDDTTYNQ